MAKKKDEETVTEEAAAPAAEVAPAVEAEVVPEVVPEVGKHVYVNLSGGHESYSLIEAPDAFTAVGDGRSWVYNRRFLYAGQNLEHVDNDSVTDIWRYRRM